jgi:hypothetical protein
LRRGYDNRARQSNGLDDGKLNIAGARRQIEDEHIEFAPFHLPQELLGVARYHRPAQNRR